jgi:lysyl-tRNA synthetase class 2
LGLRHTDNREAIVRATLVGFVMLKHNLRTTMQMTSPRQPSSDDDFRPSASWENLALRAELLGKLRAFFHQREFLEVETPVLSVDTVIDRHLDPLLLANFDLPIAGLPEGKLYLQTSPEFHMKRLLAAGAPSIYQVARAFRAGERGRLHNPEFTLVEWYGLGHSMDEGMRFLSDLCEALLDRGTANRISYTEAFEQHAGVNPHTCDLHDLFSAASTNGIAPPDSIDPYERDGWLDLLLVELVQPHLGQDGPTILYDYPASQAALAQVRESDPPVAERFELYVAGIELANGYHELLDPAELGRRNQTANEQRAGDDKPTLPEESRLLFAMTHGLPPCCGAALGFDRLVMIAAGAEKIDDVLAFPIERA